MNYYYQAKTPIGVSQEYGVRALELARRKAGNDLYSILYSQRLPAVVDIEESSTERKDPYGRELENITITFIPSLKFKIHFYKFWFVMDLGRW